MFQHYFFLIFRPPYLWNMNLIKSNYTKDSINLYKETSSFNNKIYCILYKTYERKINNKRSSWRNLDICFSPNHDSHRKHKEQIHSCEKENSNKSTSKDLKLSKWASKEYWRIISQTKSCLRLKRNSGTSFDWRHQKKTRL